MERLTLAGFGGLALAADAFGSPADPVVLLLPGAGQTRHAWASAARRLAENGWYAIALDMRGHGDSGWSPDGIYDLDRIAADYAHVANRFPRPVLVGASMGGLAAIAVVGERLAPNVAALVLVDVAPRLEDEGADRIRQFMLSGIGGYDSLEELAEAVGAFRPGGRPTAESLRRNMRQEPGGRWFWHWDPAFLAGNGPGAADARVALRPVARLEAAAAEVTVPTLLVRGATSELVSERNAAELLRMIPHAEEAVISGGHMVPGDRNDRFHAAVSGFLDRVVRPGL